MSGKWSAALQDGNRSVVVVREFLAEYAPAGFTVDEISKRTRVSDSTVYTAVQKLKATGAAVETRSARKNRPRLWSVAP